MSTGVNVGILSKTARTGPVTTPPTFTVNDEYTEAAYFVVGSDTGGGFTLSVKVQGVSNSGMTFDLLTSTTISGAGTTVMKIGPAYTAGANIAKDYMPASFNVVPTLSGTATFGIDAIFV